MAWTMKQNIMAVMARRKGTKWRLENVRQDAISTGATKPSWHRSKDFRKRETACGAKRRMTPDAEVVTDSLVCWTALGHADHNHRIIRTGSGRKTARMAPFKQVDATLGNIKSAITGTYRSSAQITPNVISPAWLGVTTDATNHSTACTQPTPYRNLIVG